VREHKGGAGGGGAKKKKKGKGKGGRKQRKEEAEEAEEAGAEEEAAAAAEDFPASVIGLSVSDLSDPSDASPVGVRIDYDAECPICQETAEEVDSAFLVLPCDGRHGICRPCAYSWRATCVKSAAEFSCPMCRESLEGWVLE
jgi:hypothetical protein